jgi:hypothetical protein
MQLFLTDDFVQVYLINKKGEQNHVCEKEQVNVNNEIDEILTDRHLTFIIFMQINIGMLYQIPAKIYPGL